MEIGWSGLSICQYRHNLTLEITIKAIKSKFTNIKSYVKYTIENHY